MSDHSEQKEDDQGSSGSSGISGAETDRYGFLLGNGDTNSNSDEPCPQLVRHREMKWLSLMNQWDQALEKKTSKIKGQCQKGIPASVRAKCWPLLCGATHRKKKNEKLYETLEKAPGQQSWIDVIKRDTDRQFPFHEMFLNKDSHGQQGLLQVLKAYTQFRPEEGYCQAQGPVAAVLLMNMPIEEAFWCLVQISELYLPGYYSPLLEGVLFDAALLSGILKRTCPAVYKHLQSQGVEPLMFATDWLMCLYSRHLPFNTLLRVWDLFFCYGVRVLFQVAVVLVRRCLGETRQRKECEGQMETLEQLRAVRGRVQHEPADSFIQEVCSVPLSSGDLQRQTEKELKKWKKERPGSTFDPRHRCHGYHMVWEKGREKEKEHDKKEKLSGNLTVPLSRSHSSLTPTLLRRKWRKGGSKVETEEWEGGGRRFSHGVKEESLDREQRTRSMCSMAEEFTTSRDSVTNEPEKPFKKDCNAFTDPRLRQSGQPDTWSSSDLSDQSAPVFDEEEENEVDIPTDPPQIVMHTECGGQEQEAKTCPIIFKDEELQNTGMGEQGMEAQADTCLSRDSVQMQQDNEKEEIQTETSGQEKEMPMDQEEKGDREQVEESQQEEETHGTSDQHTEDTERKQIEETELTGGEGGNIKKEEIQISVCEQPQDSTKLKEQKTEMDNQKQLEEMESLIKQPEGEIFEEIEVHEDSMKQPELQEEKEMHTESREQVDEMEVQEAKEEKIHLENSTQDMEEEDIEPKDCTDFDSGEVKQTQINSNKEEAEVLISSQHYKDEEDQDLPEGKSQQEKDLEVANEGLETLKTSEDQEHLPFPSQEVDMSQTNLNLERELPKEMEATTTDSPERSNRRNEEANVEDTEVKDPNRDHTVVKEILQRTESEPLETSDTFQVVGSSSIPQLEEMPNVEVNHKADENELTLQTRTAESSVPPHVQKETELEPSRTSSSECPQEVQCSPQREDSLNLEAIRKVDKEGAQLEPSQISESSQVVDSPSQEENMGMEVTTIPEVQPGIAKQDECSTTGVSGSPEPKVVVPQNTEIQNDPVSVQSESTTPANTSRPNSTGSSSNPHTHLRLRRSSSSQCSHPTILSEDTFKDPHNGNEQGLKDKQEYKAECEAASTINLAQQPQTPEPGTSKETQAHKGKTHTLPQAGKPKRRGLFQRFRGETPPKSPVPKIVIQDFSEGDEKLSSKERRRRRREQERKEKEEEKERKKREKELEKEKEKERKKPQTRGKSFQVPSKKDDDSDSSAYKSGSQTLRSKRNSAPHSESYF
ncbi:trichohyalin [Astyanax mexicanus]|uniref:Trichohyalin n=1 Tax=Astyanax mexicanus TaxID=7994 RepID=A0A8T2LJF7_ASTMX|nr:trichohyalin [Astyanax mexicanus]